MTASTDSNTMRALVWLGPREMAEQAVPRPQLAPDDVLIAVGAVGICGSELGGFLGHNSLRRPPLIMGHEAAGQIVEIAGGTLADGTVPAVGDRVTFNPLVTCGVCDRCRAGRENLCRERQLLGAHRPGAFAEYIAVPARQCYRLPDAISLVAGSLAEPLACGVRAVEQAGVRPESSLLILGAGPIGLCCVAVARSLGVENIIVGDMSPARLAIARDWGARTTINVREENALAAIERLSPGGVEIVIDAVGATGVRNQALAALVPGGRVVFIGLHDEESVLPANVMVRQELEIVGTFAYTPADFTRAVELLVQGTLKPGSEWLEERPLAAGPAAFADLVDSRTEIAKIVLTLP